MTAAPNAVPMNAHYRAAICTALTGPGSIVIETRARQPLQSGEVRVAVHAAGLNFPDVLMTRGGYQFKPQLPFIPGMEMAGEVIEVADGACFSLGDRVIGGAKTGCFAEEVVLPSSQLSNLPAAFSFEEGACWPAAAITAWHALNDKAALQAGESVLVLGASGGVGMAAVKLAKHFGALVIGTGSNAAKRSAILAAGADHALDPADPDLAAKVKSLTEGTGVNIVCDPVGGALALTATRAIAWGGRYLIVGFASGVIPNFPANHALIKGYSLIGLRAGESSRRDPALARRNQQMMRHLGEQGVMRPHISHRFPLNETQSALRALDARTIIGRAIIKIR
jgi:NADPH:quinone reductase